jgi:Kef-type K+ transport system membrane component KefB
MDLSLIMVTLGTLFLAGLAADTLGRKTRLPRVTLLLLCGVAFGDAGLGLLPPAVSELYDFLAITALTMVAFLLGNSLTVATLRSRGLAILSVSLATVMITIALVFVGLVAIGLPPGLALLLGAIATATDPAATQDAIAQSGRDGAFTDTLKGVVAIDDAWGLIAFSLVIVAAAQIGGANDLEHWSFMLADAGYEIGGAIVLGLAVGLPGAALTGRLRRGEPLRTEALGLVFLTAGTALWLEVSYLLAGMTAGAVIVNRARHHERAFHEIEALQWPFMLLFFILAGAAFSPAALLELGALGLIYMALRSVARVAGGWLGGKLAGMPAPQRSRIGLALLPQAGVAVGMALAAAERFPQWEAQIMSLAIGTTIAFELLAPILTVWVVRSVEPGRSKASIDGRDT